MPVNDSPIALETQGIIPETWRMLGKEPDAGTTGYPYGDSFLQRQLESVMRRHLGDVMSVDDQGALPEIVIEWLGIKLALKLINPGIDFWSKQATSLGATGRNENKQWKDRAEDLRAIRTDLEAQAQQMFLDVEPLLPDLSIVRSPDVPTVNEVDASAFTPEPNSFEPAFDRSREQFGPRTSGA